MAAAELAENLTGSVRGGSSRSRSPPTDRAWRCGSTTASEVRFGEARDLFAKLVRLETVLAINPERAPGPIDVSTEDDRPARPRVSIAG